jgi:hypothetical protein
MSSIRSNALRDFTLIKLIVTGFVGSVGFLIRYSNGDAIHRQLKSSKIIFKKYYFCN